MALQRSSVATVMQVQGVMKHSQYEQFQWPIENPLRLQTAIPEFAGRREAISSASFMCRGVPI